MVNEEISRIFFEIADLLDLEGERFKPEAYRRAARTLEQAPDDLSILRREGRLHALPGVGPAIGKKIEEYLDTGKVAYLERLQLGHPPGVIRLMHLEGLGPKTTRRLMMELGVTSPEELVKAIDAERLTGLKGFGPKRIAQFRAAAVSLPSRGRLSLPVAQSIADDLLRSIQQIPVPHERLTYAGSLRRRRESVGDLDILATSAHAAELIAAFVQLPIIENIRMSGETRATVVLKSGVQVDLRVVSPESYAAALQYFTGSKDHNVRTRSMALQRGLSINEYGVTRDGTTVPTPDEATLYSLIGLPYIRPELRENSGEVEAAQAGKLPAQPDNFLPSGEIHIHVPTFDSPAVQREWLGEAEKLGLHLLGGVRARHASEHASDARSSRSSSFVAWGLEGDLPELAEAELPWASCDYLILRPGPAGFSQPSALEELLISAKEHHRPVYLGHLEDLDAGILHLPWNILAKHEVPIEVGVSATSVTCESSLIKKAVSSGVRLWLSSRPEAPQELARLAIARDLLYRGWGASTDVAKLPAGTGSSE